MNCVIHSVLGVNKTEPLFTNRADVLPPNFVKSRSREIVCYNDRIALKFDRYLTSDVAEVPIKFQNDWKV